jgi:hypothetical protein
MIQSSILPVQRAKPQFIDRTLRLWQRRTSKVLTSEDARQIAENVTGFFQVLMEWEAAEQHTASQVTRTETNAVCHSTERRPERDLLAEKYGIDFKSKGKRTQPMAKAKPKYQTCESYRCKETEK